MMEIASLNSDIEALNTLLSKYGEKRWILNKVNSDQSARNLIGCFGGMGSLNDLYICKVNGHKIDSSEEIEVNEKIRDLLTSIHEKCVLKMKK